MFTKQANVDAARDLGIADFYRRSRRFASANFYYEIVRRRHPDTDFARKAVQGLEELAKHRRQRPRRLGVLGNRASRRNLSIKRRSHRRHRHSSKSPPWKPNAFLSRRWAKRATYLNFRSN